MKIESYLLLAGAEVVNSLRTLTYLRRGLAGAGFEVTLQSPLVVAEGGGYSDIYSDEYDYYLDSYRTQNLGCYCGTIDTGPYQSPEHDGAPWYDPSRPESGDFFGMLVDISLTSVARRSMTQRAGGGGVFGALNLSPRIIQVDGVMYAASKAGMVYGERWLARVLTGADSCGDDVASILPACAPDEVEDDTTYLRELVGVGIIDGPFHAPVTTGVRECVAQTVAFQLAAADPYLRWATTLHDASLTAGAHCEFVVPSAVAADAAVRLTISAGADALDGVVITGTVDASTVTVVDLLPYTTLVIDSSQRLVTATDADGVVIGGLDLIEFDGVFPWMVAPPGQTLEVCVDATAASFGAGATLKVEQIDREL